MVSKKRRDFRGRCRTCGEVIEDSPGKFVANFHYCLKCSEGRDFSNQHHGVRDSHRTRMAILRMRERMEGRVKRWEKGDGEDELREKFPDLWERMRAGEV